MLNKSNKLKRFNTSPNKTVRVLGIDPGYERVGVALLEKREGEKEILLFSECIITKRTLLHHERLLMLGKRVEEIINKYNPETLSIEKLYFNENQKTALLVSEARGVILFIASQKKLFVREFTPLEIKVATTGYGRADKKQMRMMINRLIDIPKTIKHDDEYDAIAAGLTSIASKERA